jgi:gliding motility-associated-like protein
MNNKLSFTFFKLLFFILFSSNLCAQPCRKQDSLALIDLYTATNGSSWTNKWDLTKPIDTWYGIRVNALGCVECIDLDGAVDCVVSSPLGNNLVGTLPNMAMTELQILNLSSNRLTGAVPNFTMPNLQSLQLSNNQLNGPLPNFDLPNLQRLQISNNQLNGGLPNFNLPNLTDLILNNNQISGSLPNFNLPNLQRLQLSTNQLTGAIPNLNLPNLVSLFLNTNQLSGTIPNFNLPKLVTLYLFENQLSGTIPNFNILTLENIRLYKNQLSGAIPNISLPKLAFLMLNGNKLTGSIPNFILPALKNLELDDNQLTGEIPPFNLPLLQILLLHNNQLSGGIPNLSCPNLKEFNAASNNLNGSISAINPSVLFSCDDNALTFEDLLPSLIPISNKTYTPQDSVYRDTIIRANADDNVIFNIEIDANISDNQYEWFKDGSPVGTPIIGNTKLSLNSVQIFNSGTYTCQITNPQLPLLRLNSRRIILIVEQSCRLKDSLALVAFYNSTNGAGWANSWDLTRPMNTWRGIRISAKGCVDSLDLEMNKLSGTIPTDIGNVVNLQYISLGLNDLSGSIPSSIKNLANLRILQLYNNKLSGPIPAEIWSLNRLERVIFSDNKLSGIIDAKVSNLANLRLLYLDNNKLSGPIPSQIGSLNKLEGLNLSNNNLGGTVPVQLSLLSNVTSIELNRNLLVGEIPVALASMKNLAILDLSDNKFDSLPNLMTISSLRILALDINKFTFDDILPNMPIIARGGTFSYEFQQPFYKDTTIIAPYGSPLTLNLGIDGSITTNKYKWFKNTVPFDTANTNRYTFKDLSPCEEGVYTVEVTNPNVPNLTLKSRKITIKVVNNPSIVPKNAAICSGQTYILPSGRSVNAVGVYRDTIKSLRWACSVDSVVVITDLKFTTLLETSLSPEICKGKTHILPDGKSVDTEGAYPVSFKTSGGCDSVVTTRLKVNNTYTKNFNAFLCKGGTYTLPDNRIVSTVGSYPVLLKSIKGCDSLVTTLVTNTATINTVTDEMTFTPDLDSLKLNVVKNDGVSQTKAWDITILKKPNYGILTSTVKGQFDYKLTKLGIKTDTFIYKLCYTDCPTNCDSAKVFIAIKKESPYNSTVGKGIIPNGNEANRRLQFSELENSNRYPENELVIINRWGQVVFQAKPYRNDWDGKNQSNQDLPAGTYYYILRLNINEGKIQKGDVTIIR